MQGFLNSMVRLFLDPSIREKFIDWLCLNKKKNKEQEDLSY
jgi:hypothetical protein